MDIFDFKKDGFKDIAQNYYFYFISENINLKEDDKCKIDQNLNDSKIIIITQNEKFNQETKEQHLIVGFEKTLIIIKNTSMSFLNMLLSANSNLFVCFLSNAKSIFIKNSIEIKNREIEVDSTFEEEIKCLSKSFIPYKATKSFKNVWKIIVQCISAYLIQKCYMKKTKYRIQKYIQDLENKSTPINISENEYVELRNIGMGSVFCTTLIFYIKRSELYVIKKPILQ